MRGDSAPPDRKRARLVADSPMEFDSVKERIAAVKDKYGREIRVFETSTASASTTGSADADMEEADAFYEFTAEDYYRLMASKKEEKHLKTKKIRDAEEAARRATIRVRFPDNHTLEVTFHPSESINSLVELLKKAVLYKELPFCIYTTPLKKQIKDLSHDFYSTGFVPGAIIYFAYDLPKDGADRAPIPGPYLQEDIMSLKGLEYPVQSEETEAQTTINLSASAQTTTSEIPEQKPVDKKKIKPKWLKM